MRGIGFKLFQEHAIFGDFAECLTISRARYAQADGQRCAVAGQADDADIVAEIFAAELRADA